MSRKVNKSMDQSVTVPFRVLILASFPNTNASGTFTELDLTAANLGARAAAIATTFEFFRIRRLKVHQMATAVNVDASNGLISGHHAVSFVESNAALTGTPTTLTQMAQYEKFDVGAIYQRIGFKVSPAQLAANPLKWYQTSATGASTDTLSPGIIVQLAWNMLSAATTSGSCITVVEGVVEFRGMITPALQYSTEDISDVASSSSKSLVDQSSFIKIAPMSQQTTTKFTTRRQ